jgi:N-acetylmuramic acid 6-phosphate etherase
MCELTDLSLTAPCSSFHNTPAKAKRWQMLEPRQLDQLSTEGRLPAARNLDLLATGAQVALLHSQDQLAVTAVGEAGDAVAAAIDAIATRMARGGRLVYVGMGTSGRLAQLDAAECPPT